MDLQDTQLGIYRLISRIGAGGMGEVWKAEDTRLHRTVAIKLLPLSATKDEEARARLLREARTAGQLYHPNIATIHHIELEGERPYIVMEFVPGETLTRAMNDQRLSEAEVAQVGAAVADALSEAHSKGVVHRDIKPDNIILGGDGRVKVLDFGIAKRFGIELSNQTSEFATQAGMILGTVNYMSPEQALGRPLDGRSDIFSLGVVLYQALTGRLPFAGETLTDTLAKIIRDEPPDLRALAPDVVPQLAAAVQKCLQKIPEARYAEAKDLRDALKKAAEVAPTVRQQRRPVGAHDAPTVITNPGVATSATTASMEVDRRKRKSPVGLAAAFLAVAVIALGAGIALTKYGSSTSEPAATSTTATEPAIPAAAGTVVEMTETTASVAPPVMATETTATVEPPTMAAPPPAPVPPATETTATVATPPPPSSDSPFLQGMDQLATSGFHYIDETGAFTSGARAARPHFQAAASEAPARLRLAVMRLFGRQFVAAGGELKFVKKSELNPTEVAMFNNAFAAATSLTLGTFGDNAQQLLDVDRGRHGSDPEFAAFAEDLQRLYDRAATMKPKRRGARR